MVFFAYISNPMEFIAFDTNIVFYTFFLHYIPQIDFHFRIGCALFRVLASSAVDREFEPRSGQKKKTYEILLPR